MADCQADKPELLRSAEGLKGMSLNVFAGVSGGAGTLSCSTIASVRMAILQLMLAFLRHCRLTLFTRPSIFSSLAVFLALLF